MSEQKDFSAQDSATIRKWEREMERGKARADASEANFTKTFADALKQETGKKALARAAREAVDQQESGQSNPTLDKVKKGGGAMFGTDDEVVTGNEPRPWEDR